MPGRKASLTAAVTTVCAGVFALSSNVAAGELPKPLHAYRWTAWPITGLALLVTFILELRRRSAEAPAKPRSAAGEARRALIDRGERSWVTTVLERSLYQEARIELGLKLAKHRLNPWNISAARVAERPRLLPAGTNATDVYRDLDGVMVLLGAPGAGKTTMLLELLRDLIAEARAGRNTPIPVMLALSSWNPAAGTFGDWVVGEIAERYDIPVRHIEHWVDNDLLILLLDGLDELPAALRQTCVEHINAFRGDHGVSKLVVSCRAKEYADMRVHFQAYGTALIQPLTTEQVNAYLDHFATSASGAAEALRADPDLRLLVTSPLMLSILLLTYGGTDQTPAPVMAATDSQTRLFATYTREMLLRRQADPYPPALMLSTLVLLAEASFKAARTVLTLDDVDQVAPPDRLRTVPATISAIVWAGGTFALVGALAPSSLGWRGYAVAALVATLILLRGSNMAQTETFVLPTWALDRDRSGRSETPRRKVSKSDVSKDAVLAFVVAALVGALTADAGVQRAFVAYVVSAGWTFVVCTVGYRRLASAENTTAAAGTGLPSPAVRRLLRRGAVTATATALILAAIVALACFPFLGTAEVIRDAAAVAVATALVLQAWIGGKVALSQFVLRLILHASRRFPFAARRFLNHATQCLFLREVGDGFIFVHRSLLEFLAQYGFHADRDYAALYLVPAADDAEDIDPPDPEPTWRPSRYRWYFSPGDGSAGREIYAEAEAGDTGEALSGLDPVWIEIVRDLRAGSRGEDLPAPSRVKSYLFGASKAHQERRNPRLVATNIRVREELW